MEVSVAGDMRDTDIDRRFKKIVADIDTIIFAMSSVIGLGL